MIITRYNKLVRDKIPALMSERGYSCAVRELGPTEYLAALTSKLREEADEFAASGKVEELVDLLEVVYAIAAQRGVSPIELEERRQAKRRERGGFEQRQFLIETGYADDED